MFDIFRGRRASFSALRAASLAIKLSYFDDIMCQCPKVIVVGNGARPLVVLAVRFPAWLRHVVGARSANPGKDFYAASPPSHAARCHDFTIVTNRAADMPA